MATFPDDTTEWPINPSELEVPLQVLDDDDACGTAEEAGEEWAAQVGQKWAANLNRLRTHLRAHGGRYPRSRCVDGVERKLGSWISNQRPIPQRLVSMLLFISGTELDLEYFSREFICKTYLIHFSVFMSENQRSVGLHPDPGN